jgi:hypothetical protein
MISGRTLPFSFDVKRLQADLQEIRDDEWQPHYNEHDYGGQWRGVALRSIGTGSSELVIHPEAPAESFRDTPVLLRCPYFREVLSAFRSPIKAVRILSLLPASFVREHSDPNLCYEHGEMRIHVPIQSSADVDSGVEFYLAGNRLHLEEGGCFYLNVSLPHRIANRSLRDRVHLVIDVEVDAWADELVERGLPISHLPHRTRGFENFRRYVLQDSSILHALENENSQQAIVATALQCGFDFAAEEIGSPDSSVYEGDFDSRGWAPINMRLQDNRAIANWVYFGRRRFTEPFFEDTVRIVLRNPVVRSFRCKAPLRLTDYARPPAGFIFHMSRCGSTLVSRTLASLPRTLVISEAPSVDSAVRTRDTDSLRALVFALGQLGEGRENRYFVKFDAWNIHYLPVIRAAFPEIPWIYLYRDPLEVLVSQARLPGLHCLPGALDPAILNMTENDIVTLSREEWSARVLAGFLSSALSYRGDSMGLFVDYRELPEAIWGCIGKHFGLVPTDGELKTMEEAAQFDAKLPRLPFAPDSASKQAEASETTRGLIETLLQPLYRQLANSPSPDVRSTSFV